ncbi:MAG: hypothetical protein IK131_01840 [Paludibacteraceae bacterium]|nr:hypothetical protein [Paludibacteraceae bacterium]
MKKKSFFAGLEPNIYPLMWVVPHRRGRWFMFVRGGRGDGSARLPVEVDGGAYCASGREGQAPWEVPAKPICR